MCSTSMPRSASVALLLAAHLQHGESMQIRAGAAAWGDGPRVGSSGKLHCFGAHTTFANHKMMTLEDAKAECSTDPTCNFIWSHTCDGKWTKCEANLPVASAGDESSCTMIKPTASAPKPTKAVSLKRKETPLKRRPDVRSLALKSVQTMADKNEATTTVDWTLCDAEVHSNLGGAGPDSGDENIRYINIATVDGQAVDLLVTNTTVYEYKYTDDNGKNECFGNFNLRSPSDVTLQFRLVKTGTEELVSGKFWFTVYDVDEAKNGIKEQVTFVTPVDGYYLMPDTELVVSGSSAGGDLTFASSVVGTSSDNPSDPEQLTGEEELRAVTVEYSNHAEFYITFGAVGEDNKPNKVSGRNFMFAGKSDLVEDAELTCESSDCEVWADPHVSGFDNKAKGPISFMGGFMSTFDRQPVDVNAYESGDFWLVKSELVRIQGRYAPSAEFGGNRSAVGAIAVGGDFIQGAKLIIEPKQGKVMWNDHVIEDKSEFQATTTGGLVHIKTYYNADGESGSAPSGVDVVLPSRVSLKVRRYNTHLDAKISMPKLSGGTDGQCGNFNGDAADDTVEHVKSRSSWIVPTSELLF